MLKKYFDKYNKFPVQLRASFWFLICGFLQKGVSVITTPIFTRLLTTAEYGQYSVFNSWLSIVTVFVSMNLYCGVYTQGLVKFEKNQKEYSSSLQGLCLTLTLIWTIIYFLFHDFWNNIFSLTTVQMLAMLLMIWATAVFNFWSIEQRVDFKYRKLVVVTIAVSIAKPLIGILLVMNADDKVTARILGLALVEAVTYTGFFLVQMRRGKKFFSGRFWKHALMFNIPLLPHYLSQSVLSSADRIMIEGMVGEASAGIYSLAHSISLIMTIFNTALLQAVEPWMYKKIKTMQTCEISKVAYPAFLIITSANILLIAFAPEIVAVFAPPTYYEAVYVIPPIAMSVYFMFAYTFFAVFEFYYEKTQYITLATVAGAILNIVLNYICIGIFGYHAAAYTTLFCYIIYALLHYCFMRRICHIYLDNAQPYDIKIVLTISIVFLLLGFAFMFTYNTIVIRYLLIIIIIAVFLVKRKKIMKLFLI